MDSPIVQVIVKPNLALQRLTTREPDLKTIEVGIAAFKAMLKLEYELAIAEGDETIPQLPEQQGDGDEYGYQNQPG